jgi:hypothetical protein
MREFLYISWLNYLGGFDYWLFTGYKDHNIEVIETGETTKNVFPGWPKSYDTFADTIRKQTFRRTRKQKVIRSQKLTLQQAEQLGEQIRSSILVQILEGTGKRDRRTVIVDDQSVLVKPESSKMYSVSFVISYTDDYPSQHV